MQIKYVWLEVLNTPTIFFFLHLHNLQSERRYIMQKRLQFKAAHN